MVSFAERRLNSGEGGVVEGTEDVGEARKAVVSEGVEETHDI